MAGGKEPFLAWGGLVANRVPTHGLSHVISSKEVPEEKEGTLSKDKDKHRSRHQNTWGVLFFLMHVCIVGVFVYV